MEPTSHTLLRDLSKCESCGACKIFFGVNHETLIISGMNYDTPGIRKMVDDAVDECPASALTLHENHYDLFHEIALGATA